MHKFSCERWIYRRQLNLSDNGVTLQQRHRKKRWIPVGIVAILPHSSLYGATKMFFFYLSSDLMSIYRVTVTYFVPYLCQLVFAAILWVKLLYCSLLWYHLNTLCWQVNDHIDISLNKLIQFYLNNTLNLRPLTPQIIPCYTHKMAIVSWP